MIRQNRLQARGFASAERITEQPLGSRSGDMGQALTLNCGRLVSAANIISEICQKKI